MRETPRGVMNVSDQPLVQLSVSEFLDRTASDAATPGGGSVAALSGSLAAALGCMVCGLTLGREKFKPVEAEIKRLAERFEQSRLMLRALVDDDARAYGALSAAFKLDKQNAKRPDAIRSAASLAAAAPLAVAGVCRQVLSDFSALEPIANPNVLSDVRVGRHLAQAALHSAGENVRVNLPFVNADERGRFAEELDALERADE